MELTQVAGTCRKPWVLGGDFNAIHFPYERKGGCSMNSAMRDFSDWIHQHDLIDLPLSGAKFTWTNNQQDPMMSQLDRFVVSPDWLDIFPDGI